MIIYAVYFIDKKGYTISKTFQSEIYKPDKRLIGSLFTALQGMSDEIISSEAQVNIIQLDNIFYHVRNFGLTKTILVTDLPEPPYNILEILGLIVFIGSFFIKIPISQIRCF